MDARNATNVHVDDFPYVIGQAVIGLFTILSNTIILAIFNKRNVATKNKIHRYVLSMAFADLLFGLICAPLVTLSSLGYPHQRFICILSSSLQLITINISIMSLLATVLAQFMSVIYPIYYTKNWTHTKINSKYSIDEVHLVHRLFCEF